MRGDWETAVEIELDRENLYHVIADTQAAAKALLYKWPTAEGEAYNAAKQICLLVLEGKRPAAEARRAFIAAAEEADLSTRRVQRSKRLPNSRPTYWANRKASSRSA